jgi:hypothetical protein
VPVVGTSCELVGDKMCMNFDILVVAVLALFDSETFYTLIFALHFSHCRFEGRCSMET